MLLSGVVRRRGCRMHAVAVMPRDHRQSKAKGRASGDLLAGSDGGERRTRRPPASIGVNILRRLARLSIAPRAVDLHEFRVSDAASAMRADRVFGVAREAALRECEPDVALALVAVGNGVVDWAVAFAAAARCEVAEAT